MDALQVQDTLAGMKNLDTLILQNMKFTGTVWRSPRRHFLNLSKVCIEGDQLPCETSALLHVALWCAEVQSLALLVCSSFFSLVYFDNSSGR